MASNRADAADETAEKFGSTLTQLNDLKVLALQSEHRLLHDARAVDAWESSLDAKFAVLDDLLGRCDRQIETFNSYSDVLALLTDTINNNETSLEEAEELVQKCFPQQRLSDANWQKRPEQGKVPFDIEGELAELERQVLDLQYVVDGVESRYSKQLSMQTSNELNRDSQLDFTENELRQQNAAVLKALDDLQVLTERQ